MSLVEGQSITTRRWWQLVFPILFVSVGLFLVGVGGKGLVDDRRFLATAVPADGELVDIAAVVEHDSKRDRTVYYPVIQFTTARDDVVEFQADEAVDPDKRHVGDQMRILYDPANPRHAKLDTVSSRWAGALIPGLVGLVQVVVGGFLFRQWRRGRSLVRFRRAWWPGPGRR